MTHYLYSNEQPIILKLPTTLNLNVFLRSRNTDKKEEEREEGEE